MPDLRLILLLLNSAAATACEPGSNLERLLHRAPEPTWAVMLGGLALLHFARRRRAAAA